MSAIDIATPDEVALEVAEKRMAAELCEAVRKEYPDHLWAVQVQGGVAVIKNLSLEGQWGFVLHLHKLDDMRKEVIKAGGELLERFRISRGKPGAGQAQEFLRERMKSNILKLPDWAR